MVVDRLDRGEILFGRDPSHHVGILSALGRNRRAGVGAACQDVAVATPEPITPDTKDWTWVLERPCPECGFDPAGVAGDDLGPAIRDNAAGWPPVLGSAGAAERPRGDVWSPTEYACHVRDVHSLFANPAHPYTRGLLASVEFERYAPRERLQSIPGVPARLDAVPPGCPFHPRCAFAVGRCMEIRPELGSAPGFTTETACIVAQAGELEPAAQPSARGGRA